MTLIVFTPFLFASTISWRPRTEPAAVWMIHSPFGAAKVSMRPNAVTGLTCPGKWHLSVLHQICQSSTYHDGSQHSTDQMTSRFVNASLYVGDAVKP